MASPRRPARLVPMVLPLLHGPPDAGRRPATDQTLESDPPACAADRAPLRAGRSDLPPAAAPGASALGLRQPQNLMVCTRGAARAAGRPPGLQESCPRRL